MRKVSKAVVGLLLLSVLLAAPGSGWAEVKAFEYTGIRSYSLPKQIQFADERGNLIEKMVMKGGEVRTIYVDVKDFDGNGVWNANDYRHGSFRVTVSLDVEVSPDIYPDTETLLDVSPDLKPRFERAVDAVRANYVYASWLTQTADLLSAKEDLWNSIGSNIFPRRLSLLTVQARQQAGNQGSPYNEEQAALEYALYFGNQAVFQGSKTPERFEGSSSTPRMSILIRPSDQGGGDGDNGGGSCDALALGSAAFLAPGLFLLRRRRK